jgi:isoamylase
VKRRPATRPCAVAPGERDPVGATWQAEQTNFSVYSRQASGMELLLYADAEAAEPFQVIALDPACNRSAFFWHVAVKGLPLGTLYNWRVRTLPGGPALEVLDPAARAVSSAGWDRAEACKSPGHRLGLRGAVTDPAFDWGPRAPAPRSLDGAVIYELHVGSFTRHPSSGVKAPGTFAGLIEKIPYLRDLGITHVELLPVAAFDEQDVPPSVRDRQLHNYWGYSPYALAAPHPGYCTSADPSTHPEEFRRLVQACHAAGIGVILDVVLNHTAEGGTGGPVINYKALVPDIFYHRDGDDYRDYTGCGNSINCNHPLVTQMLLDALSVWARDMRVDGFRLDLASVLTRDPEGAAMKDPPCIAALEFSPALKDLALIAEPWDAGGLYHVGNFPGLAWSEWNGRYRDTLRRFLRGDPGLAAEVATCLAGSSDLYQASDRPPAASVNFITCHDGFTLMDLVSHEEKHNEANGEDNRDGSDHNLSWNCGTEGETLDEAVNALRRRHARNGLALLLLSQGVPMLLAGDEVLRSQRGNNNAWCQDNELSWFDWRLAEANSDMLRFVREMIGLRRRHPSLARKRYLTGRTEPARDIPDITWHGVELMAPRWTGAANGGGSDRDGRFLAFTLAASAAGEEDLHVIINMSGSAESVALPVTQGRRWHLAVDTARPSPEDIVARVRQVPWRSDRYVGQPRSVVVLEAR